MSQQPEVDLYCCPFCGVSVLNGEQHTENCFFTLSEKLRGSNGQDVVLAQKVADAWKKRAVPSGFKLVSTDFGEDAGNTFSAEHHASLQVKSFRQGCDVEILNDDVKNKVYPAIFRHLVSVW